MPIKILTKTLNDGRKQPNNRNINSTNLSKRNLAVRQSTGTEKNPSVWGEWISTVITWGNYCNLFLQTLKIIINAVGLSGGESGTLRSISLGSLRWSPASQQSFLPLRNKLMRRPEAGNLFLRVFMPATTSRSLANSILWIFKKILMDWFGNYQLVSSCQAASYPPCNLQCKEVKISTQKQINNNWQDRYWEFFLAQTKCWTSHWSSFINWVHLA